MFYCTSGTVAVGVEDGAVVVGVTVVGLELELEPDAVEVEPVLFPLPIAVVIGPFSM
jgi:hypothetical protein